MYQYKKEREKDAKKRGKYRASVFVLEISNIVYILSRERTLIFTEFALKSAFIQRFRPIRCATRRVVRRVW